MNRGRITSGVLAAIAAGALGLTLTASSASASARSASGRSASARPARQARPTRPTRPEVINCLGKGQVEPRDLVLACADGNSAVTALTWTSWTPKLASAAGTMVLNDCIPNCTAGHFHGYPVFAVAWGAAAYRHSQRYTELTLIFTGTRPSIYDGRKWAEGPRTYTTPLWAPAPN
jgi:hypothetical protein